MLAHARALFGHFLYQLIASLLLCAGDVKLNPGPDQNTQMSKSNNTAGGTDGDSTR